MWRRPGYDIVEADHASALRRRAMQILKVRFHSPKEFQEAYQADSPNSRLFCPTPPDLAAGSQVISETSADERPNKAMVRGAVKWWRPALPRLRVRAGALIELANGEQEKRDFVLRVLGGGDGRGQLRKRKHTRIPVEVAGRDCIPGGTKYHASGLRESSGGGGVLGPPHPPPLHTPSRVGITTPRRMIG